ncbi:MAG TPA: ATPase, T2SS/T4P/T4SS family [Candidatus Sulfotelmatobacter sp.]|nr:ATPase, T2SS/T4P/T4SS family [Candidatus Sulfotelmatobacter sp.]
MSEVRIEAQERNPEGAPAVLAQQPVANGGPPAKPQRFKITIHRLDGGLEDGVSDSRSLRAEGYPIYPPPDADRPRLVPIREIKYVVFGSVEDPNLESDPGDNMAARKAILRFRDGEWIAAYMDQGQQPDGEGVAIQIRLTERQRVIPAVAASQSLLEMQFVDMWTPTPATPQPQRRRSDIMEAAARQGRDLNKLANEFRDRLALIRDVGLTTGDTLAFSRAVRTHLDRFLSEDGIELSSQEKSALADIILRAAVGYGPLDSLLHDRSVSEIMVNGPDQVFIERRGVLTKAEVRFEDENQLLETIRRMVATTGRHIDGLNPMVDARLPDGSRVNAIIRPAAIHGAALTIRKFKDAVLGLEDLTREGSLSPSMAEFLQAAVLGRMNILVSGGTGSGKTTTLNVIARFIPHNQRVITIEDAAELQIDHPHVIALEHRPPNVEGKGELTIRQLLRNSLRMRPDRILVGEVRGAEALDMLQAMNTGHDGSMSTIHSNSARDALSRLETMVMMASIDIPYEAVRAQIASAVNLIIHQARMPDGRRKIAQIAELVGYDANGPKLRDIFLLGMGSDLRLEYNATGYVPTSLDKAAFYGVQVNKDLFDQVKSRFVPAGSDSMMPVVKDPLVTGQRGSAENVVREFVFMPFSSDRPGSAATPSVQEEIRELVRTMQMQQAQASAAQPTPSMAATPEMQEEMRKLIEAARSATAELHAVPIPHPEAPIGFPAQPQPAYGPPPATPSEGATPGYAVPPTQLPPPAYTPPSGELPPAGQAPPPYYPPAQLPTPLPSQAAFDASQALQAATAMARATSALGQLAAASGGYAGMLPTVRSEGKTPAGASRRIQAVIETILTKHNLNLRMAEALTQAFEGAELKGSDYAAETKISKESGGRELRQAVEAGLLQVVRYPQGEAGFRASQGLLREVAEGLGQPINAATPLTPETIIGSLAVGQTEGTVTIMFTDVEESTRLLSTRGFTESHEIMKAYETVIDEKIGQHAGRRIKGLGDGYMISFGSVRHGVECALDIQEAIAEYSKQNPERKLKIRIGLNTGEVVEEAGDIFGAAVNVAARVAGKARGGEILVSEVVRQLVGPVSEIKFDYRGRYKLKGFPDRWRLHQVTAGERREAPRALPSGDGFVDREQEKLDIRTVLDRAATGTGGMLFLTGPPGIGASRLASEMASEAAAKGWLVYSGRCVEQNGRPFEPFREVLATIVAGSTVRTLQEPAARSGQVLSRLVPSLRQKVRGMPAAVEVPTDKLREQLFKATFEFLTGVQGSKPMLLVLDDLQFADEATVLLLRDLAERVNGSHIVVLGTYWDTELDSARPFTTVLSRLLRRRRAQRVALGPLSDHDVERIVAATAEKPLTPVQMIGIQAATEGNPLFVEHSVLYMAESDSMLGGAGRTQGSFTEEDLELAQSVRGLIGRRLERLSEPAQRMLVAAAVIGRDFDVPLLEAFGELSGHELRDALEEATRGRFLVSAGPDRYRFAHDLIRQRVLAPLPLPRLQAYHLAVADTLERVSGRGVHQNADEIGYHLYQSGAAADPIRTAGFLAQSARSALSVGAFEEVLRLVDSALVLLPAGANVGRAEALTTRGHALWGLGRIDDARAAWKGAVQRYEELEDAKAVEAVHRLLAQLEARNDPQGEPAEPPEPAVEPSAPETDPAAG